MGQEDTLASKINRLMEVGENTLITISPKGVRVELLSRSGALIYNAFVKYEARQRFEALELALTETRDFVERTYGKPARPSSF